MVDPVPVSRLEALFGSQPVLMEALASGVKVHQGSLPGSFGTEGHGGISLDRNIGIQLSRYVLSVFLLTIPV